MKALSIDKSFLEPLKKILLHSCCAPCSCGIMEKLMSQGIALTVFYFNPNIQPVSEYEKRKTENKRFADKLGIPFVDADYDVDAWLACVQGLEHEPERGLRCTECFDFRMERTASYAIENGFSTFTTSLGVSRHKNQAQVYASGLRAAAKYPGLSFWDYDWRQEGGAQRAGEISRSESFYRQRYCGCMFSKP